MVFSSMVFLCVFLPIVFVLYHILPSLKGRNMILIICSLFFYAYGEPVYVILMVISTILNYLFGRLLGAPGRAGKKGILAFAVLCNLGILGFFKYANMLIGTVNTLFGQDISLLELSLPIGISFFTFQAMSYIIDVYRGDVECWKSYPDVLLYISFFPQLIAGPIVKFHDIQAQIADRKTDVGEIAAGFRRFIFGLGKKVLISNVLAAAADAVFEMPGAEAGFLGVWVGAAAYMLQIYYDFSGYSDMAIGLGHMFGFSFKENFRYPYMAENIQDFWRRWHISLSTWFKEYLYIPLGGNRKGRVRTCLNKLIVFFCTGLWYGASWTFVVWGLFHGIFLLLEEALPIRRLPKALGHIYAAAVVCVGFVIFRADTLRQSLGMIGTMFAGWNAGKFLTTAALEQLTPMFLFIFAVAVAGCFPIIPRMRTHFSGKSTMPVRAAGCGASVVLLLLCMFSLSSGNYNPFIYFRF